MNSSGSDVSDCQSMMRFSQATSAVGRAVWSLYCQWAATPCSARACISQVRICTSSGLPCGPTTVVCSDW